MEIKQISHSIKLTNYILLFTVIDQFILNEIRMTFALKYSWFDFSHAPNIINLLAIEVRQSWKRNISHQQTETKTLQKNCSDCFLAYFSINHHRKSKPTWQSEKNRNLAFCVSSELLIFQSFTWSHYCRKSQISTSFW